MPRDDGQLSAQLKEFLDDEGSWLRRIARLVSGSCVAITASEITLRHPVPGDTEGNPRIPFVARALDAEGKVLFTCSQ